MKLIAPIFCFLFLTSAFCQEVNADSILRVSQTLVEKNKMNEAIDVLKQTLQLAPDNQELQIQLGRVYSWSGDYTNSIAQLKPLMSQTPVNGDALEALLNTYLWSKGYPELLELAQFASVKVDPNNPLYRIRAIQALIELNELEKAENMLNEELKKDPSNQELRALQTQILQKKKHAVIVSYMNTSFSNPGTSPIHIAEVAYKQIIKKTTLIGRVSAGYLFQQTSAQAEIDYYRSIKKRSYVCVTAGIGDQKTIFPTFRLGAEIFHTNKTGRWESSLGTRYLKYAATDVLLSTASLSYYHFQWTPTVRVYLADVNGGYFPAFQLSASHYNEISERRIQFDASYGTTPYNTLFNADVFTRTNAWRIGAQYEFRVARSILIRPIFMYELEEFIPDVTRNRFTFQCIFTKRF